MSTKSKNHPILSIALLMTSLGSATTHAHPVLPLKIEADIYLGDKLTSHETMWIQDDMHTRTEIITDMRAAMAANQMVSDMTKKMMEKSMAGMPKTSKSIRMSNDTGTYSWSDTNPRKEVMKIDDPNLTQTMHGSVHAYWGDFSALEKAGFKLTKTGSEVVDNKSCDVYRIDLTPKTDPRLASIMKDAQLWVNKGDQAPVKTQTTLSGVIAGMGKPYTLYKSYQKHAGMPAGIFELPHGYTVVSYTEKMAKLREAQEQLKRSQQPQAK